ncbi:hypothetical protein GCM10027093_03100 [Paraburkholderia jirisanensis]
MTWTLEQAAQRAQQIISSSCAANDTAIICDATREFDVGWVFFYQSSRFLETGDIQHSLTGNAPLFVSRQDGQAVFISYQRPIAESIDAYRACGNPNASEQPQIRLTGWSAGANKVRAIELIRQHSRLGLADAKRVVDRCLALSEATVITMDVPSAKQLVFALAEIGFLGEIVYK